MSLTIELLPVQELQIQEEAEREGVSAEEIVKRTVAARFPTQTNNGHTNHPNQATLDLLALWEREDALRSDEERAEDARIYAEIERDGIERVRF